MGEKNIFAELAEITTIAAQTNIILKAMFKMGYDNEHALIEKMHAVRDLEKKSDEVAFKLSEEITSGAVSPNILDDLIQCCPRCRRHSRYVLLPQPGAGSNGQIKTCRFQLHQEADWITLFENMLNLADQSLSKLKQALTSSSVPEILQLRKEIETLEENGDDVKDAGFDKLYAYAGNMHFLQFYTYSELLHKSDDVLDGCEDLSDLIVSIVTSILK